MTALLLDYDESIPADFVYRVRSLVQVMGWRVRSIRIDKTRRGYHAIVELREKVPFVEVVCAQAILGSDARREAFNLRRARTIMAGGVPVWWQRRANVLYGVHEREGLRA